MKNTQSASTAREPRPLHIVDTQNQTWFEFAIDRLEREVIKDL